MERNRARTYTSHMPGAAARPPMRRRGEHTMTLATAPMSASSRAATDEFQLVVFELGEERYGLDIATVYEIIRHQPVTAVPQAPSFVEGVINLRGRIIPVVDLRRRFGMMQGELTKASRIVVCEAAGTRVGLVVDGVSEVLMVSADAIEQTPEVASGYDTQYLKGIAKLGERLVILLDLAGLFGEADAAALVAAAG
jgi:purine-binding chemotaxis protein CheW